MTFEIVQIEMELGECIIEIENTSAIHFLLWLGGRKFEGGVYFRVNTVHVMM